MARVTKSLPLELNAASQAEVKGMLDAVPLSLVVETLLQGGVASKRKRLLPAHVVVYFSMALSRWPSAPLQDVYRLVHEVLSNQGVDVGSVQVSKAALSKARIRLGSDVFERIAERTLMPLGDKQGGHKFSRGRRLMLLNNCCFEVAKSPANLMEFEVPVRRPWLDDKPPQLRLISLIECRTKAVLAAEMGSARKFCQSNLIGNLLAKLSKEMIVLAEPNFYSFEHWRKACSTGALLLWRVQTSSMPVEKCLPDGSYLTTVRASERSGRSDDGLSVRVFQYDGVDPHTQITSLHRVATNVLDPKLAQATDLLELYLENVQQGDDWERFKSFVPDASAMLRSLTPDLVRQDVWAMLLSHFSKCQKGATNF